jgi:hypothetical protein
MDRTISAPATPFLKFLLPPVWILVFGWFTYGIWTHPETVVLNGVKGAATRADQWLFLFAFCVGTLIILYYVVPLKRVILTEAGLRISNYHEQILVPFDMIQRVSQSRWIGGRTITIVFRTDTRLGDAIRFAPSTQARLAFWRDDEIVTELRHLARLRPE